MSLLEPIALALIFSVGMYVAEIEYRKKKKWMYPFGFISSLYFLGLSAIVIYLFILDSIELSSSQFLFSVSVIVITYLVSALLYRVVKRYVPPPREFLREHGVYTWLHLNQELILPKLSNIFFQQIIVTAFVLFLSNIIGDIWKTSVVFGVVFGIVHFGTYIYASNGWASYFTLPSFVAGAIFSFILLSTEYGFFYNILIHWAFYLFSGIALWIIKQDPSTTSPTPQ